MPGIGSLAPRFRFALRDGKELPRLCPRCDRRSHLLHVPLAVYLADQRTVAVAALCRFCPDCDLLMIGTDEIDRRLARCLSSAAKGLLHRSYVVLGTLDRMQEDPFSDGASAPEDLVRCLHDFREVLRLPDDEGSAHEPA